MRSPSLPISALPEIRDLIDGAEGILKADNSRIRKRIADPAGTLPPAVVAFNLHEPKYDVKPLAAHSRQQQLWMKETIPVAEPAEVVRLKAPVPEILPLIQRLTTLATGLDSRAKGGTA